MKSTKRLQSTLRSSVSGAPIDRRLRLVESTGAPGSAVAWTDSILDTSHGRISVRLTHGKAMPIVLLHGHKSSKDVFRGQMASDAGAQYRMIALDLPGHGLSADAIDPARTYSISGYADLVIEVLEALGIDHAAFFGWSLGGHVALELMDRFPGTTGLLISGTSPVPNRRETAMAGFRDHPAIQLLGTGDMTEQERQAFASMMLGGILDERFDLALRRTDSRACLGLCDLLSDPAMADHKRLVETSGIPVAVVNGADDPVVNVDYLMGLSYAKLWGRRCCLVPRTGHAPFYEQPEIFNNILRRFLRRMEGRLRAQLHHPSLCFSG